MVVVRLSVVSLVALALAVACAACDADSTDSDTGSRTETVIAEPDRIAFRFTESGGIAGETVIDLIVYGDGHGTVTSFGGEPQTLAVPVAELNEVLVQLETAGVHELDPDDHPEVAIADGMGLALTVHSINGTSGVAAYGLLEAPDRFGRDWREVFDAGRRAALVFQEQQ